jgi:hypothetical protein
LRRNNRVHLDANQLIGELGSALCGWISVPTTDDVAAVTCKSCLARLKSGARTATPARSAGTFSMVSFAAELHAALELGQSPQTPTAPPPPRLSPALWDASCRGAENGRCRSDACALCAWDTEADRWAHVKPWNEGGQPVVDGEDAPRWRSLNAALRSLVASRAGGPEHRQHSRAGSHTGTAGAFPYRQGRGRFHQAVTSR